MDLASFQQLFTAPAVWGAIGTILVLLASFAWVVRRTGSIHPLRYRVWKLVYGKAAPVDRTVERFLDQQTCLMSFRFHSGLGLRVRTLAQAERIIKWLGSNDEDIAAVRRAGAYFDVEKLAIRADKLANKWPARGWLAGLSACTLGLIFTLGSIPIPEAILKLRDTGTWIRAVSDGGDSAGCGLDHRSQAADVETMRADAVCSRSRCSQTERCRSSHTV